MIKAGAGLGLPLVKSFVEHHGGTVRLFSEVGKGTTVECHLPLGEPKAAESTKPNLKKSA